MKRSEIKESQERPIFFPILKKKIHKTQSGCSESEFKNLIETSKATTAVRKQTNMRCSLPVLLGCYVGQDSTINQRRITLEYL